MKNNTFRGNILNLFNWKIQFILLVAMFLTICRYVSGQATGDPKEDFLYGEFYISQGMYNEALPFYLSALTFDSNNCNLNYRVGLCYSKIIGEQNHALAYLKKSILDIDLNYMEGKYKSNKSPVESWLLLGDAFHLANELTQASYSYYKYLDFIGNSDEAKILMVKKKIAGLGISYEFQRSEKRLKMVNMGSAINSRFSDYNPILNGDQTLLIYTQYWESFDRIMMSHKIDNTWSVPVDINKQIGSEGDCYTSSLSYDGKELYLIRYGENNYDIYVSKFVDGQWTKMLPISGKINSKHRESSVCISADGNYLYFSSDRPGGEGGFDIYSARREGNTWIDIKNLGKTINTPKNEEAPYITFDGTTLYFSSNGHETIGNMDILYSDMNDQGEWQNPQNIGSPINTTNDDLFYSYYKNTQTGYFSRDLPEGFGKNDIYMIVNENVKDLPTGSFQVENQIESKLDTRKYSNNSIINGSDSARNGSSPPLRKLPNPDNTTQNLGTSSTNTAIVPVTPLKASTGVASESFSDGDGSLQHEGGINKNDSQTQLSAQNNTMDNGPEKEQVNNTNQDLGALSENAEIISATPVAASKGISTSGDLSSNDISKQNKSEIKETDSRNQLSDKNKSIKQKSEKKKATNISDSISGNKETTMDNYPPMPDKEKESEVSSTSKNVSLESSDSIPIYTIQVLALKYPKKYSKNKLSSLKLSYGEDGFHRYTISEFKGWSAALSKLDSIRSNGFPDAFIRNINTIPNYSKTQDVKKAKRK